MLSLDPHLKPLRKLQQTELVAFHLSRGMCVYSESPYLLSHRYCSLDVSTSYVDHLHAKQSAPPSHSASQSPSPPKTPSHTHTTQTSTIGNSRALTNGGGDSNYSTMPPSIQTASFNCDTLLAPPQFITESTPLIINDVRPKSRSLCNYDYHRDESLLPLILLNSPRLSRGGLPLSGMVWGRDIGCLCRMAFTQACEQENTVFADEDEPSNAAQESKSRVGRKRQITGILVCITSLLHSIQCLCIC